MRWPLPLMLCCAACVTPPAGAREPTPREMGVIAAVAHECDAETLDAVLVAVPETDADMYRLTGYCGATEPGQCDRSRCNNGCAHGAYRHWREGPWPFVLAEPWSPLLVLWRGSYSEQLLAHEATHLAAECRGDVPDHHGAQ